MNGGESRPTFSNLDALTVLKYRTSSARIVITHLTLNRHDLPTRSPSCSPRRGINTYSLYSVISLKYYTLLSGSNLASTRPSGTRRPLFGGLRAISMVNRRLLLCLDYFKITRCMILVRKTVRSVCIRCVCINALKYYARQLDVVEVGTLDVLLALLV
jgi:hypothetical protein